MTQGKSALVRAAARQVVRVGAGRAGGGSGGTGGLVAADGTAGVRRAAMPRAVVVRVAEATRP